MPLLPLCYPKGAKILSKTFDRYASLVFLALGVFIIFYSKNFSQSSYGSVVGPNAVPQVLGFLFILLSALNLYGTFRAKAEVEKEKVKLEYKRFLILLVDLIAYCLLIEPIGYVISTFLFLLVGFQAMEKGKYLPTLLLAALIPIVVYYGYVELMKGSLPGLPF